MKQAGMPATHRLTPLEVKLLHALQKFTVYRERERWAVQMTPEELKGIKDFLKSKKFLRPEANSAK